MSKRAAILTKDGAAGHVALMGALKQVHSVTEVRSGAGGAGRRAWWLASFRPHIVIAGSHGADPLLAALYRTLFPRSRLLIRLQNGPRDGIVRRLVRGLVLQRADAVLVEGAGVLSEPWQAGLPGCGPMFPLSGPSGLDAFLACPLPRAPGSVHRLIYVGPLTPRSGATDILLCVAAWASQHRDHPIEIWWAGEGDLAGILDAQPLPPGMTQRFLGPLDRAELADRFAQCGILLLPLDHGAGTPAEAAPVAEALAAGLVVVGSRNNVLVRQLVADGVTGWVFDPRRPGQLGHAVARALGAVSDELATMRAAGRDRMTRLAAQTDAERLQATLAFILPAAAPAARPGPATLSPQAIGIGLAGRR